MTEVGEIVTTLPKGARVVPKVGEVVTEVPQGAAVRQASPPPPIPEPMASFIQGEARGPEALSDFPTSLEEAVPGSRAAVIGGAALAGTVAGAPASPVGGPLIGGMLGTGAGTLAFRNLEDLADQFGFIARPRSPGLRERITEAGREMAIDAAFAGAAELFRPVLGTRALLAKIFKLGDPQNVRLQNMAQDLRIPVGATDVGGEVPRSVVQTTAVFPITGTPARTALAEKEKAVVARVGEIIDDLAPSATLTSAGIDLKDSAIKRFGKFKTISARLYDRFRALAADAGAIIPTDSTKEQALSLTNALNEERILINSGQEVKEIAPDLEGATRQYLADLTQLPENITVQQYRGLVRKLQNLMDQARASGLDFSEAAQMKAALEIDLNNINADIAPNGEEIHRALNAANTFYANNARRFETATARRFGRFDRNVFGPGPFRAGTLNEDEIASVVLNLKSPQAIKDLASLVGKKPLREAGAAHFRNAFRRSISQQKIAGREVDVLDPDKFLTELGITGKLSTEEGANTLMRAAGVDPQDLQDVLELAQKLEVPGEPGKFLKRRVILGGAGAAAALAGFGGALAGSAGTAGGGLGTMAVGTFLARHISKIVADPRKLELLKTALDTAKDEAILRAAWARLANAVRIEATGQPRTIRPTQ